MRPGPKNFVPSISIQHRNLTCFLAIYILIRALNIMCKENLTKPAVKFPPPVNFIDQLYEMNKSTPFRFARLVIACATLAPTCFLLAQPSLQFEKQFIAAESFESVAVLDIDGDGTLDLLSGSF